MSAVAVHAQAAPPPAPTPLHDLHLECGARRVPFAGYEIRYSAREGCRLCDADGTTIGRGTSGGFGPTVGGPIATGYVPPRMARPGSAVCVMARSRAQDATVPDLPFLPHRYVKGGRPREA